MRLSERRTRFGELRFWPRVGAGARAAVTAFAPFVVIIALRQPPQPPSREER
jgi:hypothetical protein